MEQKSYLRGYCSDLLTANSSNGDGMFAERTTSSEAGNQWTELVLRSSTVIDQGSKNKAAKKARRYE